MWAPVAQRRRRGESLGQAFVQADLRRGRRRFGSYIVHGGAVVVLVAIAVSSTMRSTKEVHLKRGETASLGAYTITLLGTEERSEPHRQSSIARFDVTKNGQKVATLEPRMNQYESMREPVGTPDVYSTAAGDLYLSVMNIDVAQQAAGVSIVSTPMVVWIWIAVFLMGLGGLVALIPARQPALVRETSPVVGEEVIAS
jgi:cytochrome c-type biogenesis protein CcmF